MKYLDTFILKGSAMGSEDVSMKLRIRDHIVWKSDKVWKHKVEREIEQVRFFSKLPLTSEENKSPSKSVDESEVKSTEQSINDMPTNTDENSESQLMELSVE